MTRNIIRNQDCLAGPSTDETPVLFRCDRSGQFKGEVTAVFPCEPDNMSGYTMSSYAHIGQHGGCSFGWYNQTRAAKPEEYADLKAELKSAPYNYRLKVYHRLNKHLRMKFDAELKKLRKE